MTNNFTSVLTIINFVVALCIIIGAYIGIRSGIGHASSEIQQRVRDGLHDENELLQGRVKRLESEVDRLKGLLEATSELVKQKGFTLIVEEDTVTLEGEGNVSRIRRKARSVQKPALRPAPKKDIP